MQPAGECDRDSVDLVEKVSYEKNLVERDIQQTKGNYVVNLAEDLVTVEKISYEKNLV